MLALNIKKVVILGIGSLLLTVLSTETSGMKTVAMIARYTLLSPGCGPNCRSNENVSGLDITACVRFVEGRGRCIGSGCRTGEASVADGLTDDVVCLRPDCRFNKSLLKEGDDNVHFIEAGEGCPPGCRS